MSHRKPPLSPYRPGWCQWCDLEIVPRLKKDGTPHKIQSSMHRGCASEYWMAQNASKFRPLLIARDGERCVDCGAAPYAWGPQNPPSIVWRGWTRLGAAQYCEVKWRSLLEVDHEIPLWKVAHLPPAKRREYFKPGNLKLRCPTDHKLKSAKEAAERAHHKRLVEPKKRKGRKLQGRGFGPSRPFDKTLRRRFDRRVEVRT